LSGALDSPEFVAKRATRDARTAAR
jgi:hypothetical protein